MISRDQLINIIKPTKYNDKTIDIIYNTLLNIFNMYKINTPLRVCHFLAQVLHESGAFKYKEEIASGDAYDTRVDLGNTPEKDGDGRLYKGRGFIQLTGKTNYKQASRYFADLLKIEDKEFLVKNPKLAGEYPYCGLIAGYFWDTRNLNLLADKDDIKTITKRVNGGYNGLQDRINWYNKCKNIIK